VPQKTFCVHACRDLLELRLLLLGWSRLGSTSFLGCLIGTTQSLSTADCIPATCRAPTVRLEDHHDAFVVVYMLAPSGHPLAAAATQLVCAACLAPCLPPEASPPADTSLQEEAEAGAKAPQGSGGGGGSNGVSRGRGGGDGAPAPPSPPIFDLVAQAASAVSTPASTVGSPSPVELCYSQPAPPLASSHQPPSQRSAAQPPPAPAATSAAGAAAPAADAAMHDAAAAGGAAPELVAKYHGAARDTHTPRLGRSTHSGELDADSPLPEGQPLDIALQVHDGQSSSISVAPCTCLRQYQSTSSVPADNASAVADANSPSCPRDQLCFTRQCSVHKANPKRIWLTRWCPNGCWRMLPARRCGRWHSQSTARWRGARDRRCRRCCPAAAARRCRLPAAAALTSCERCVSFRMHCML